MKQTIQAKRLRESLNRWNVTRDGEHFTKPIYTPRKKGCFVEINVHADALSTEQIEGLRTDLPHVDIYNDQKCGFSIITY